MDLSREKAKTSESGKIVNLEGVTGSCRTPNIRNQKCCTEHSQFVTISLKAQAPMTARRRLSFIENKTGQTTNPELQRLMPRIRTRAVASDRDFFGENENSYGQTS